MSTAGDEETPAAVQPQSQDTPEKQSQLPVADPTSNIGARDLGRFRSSPLRYMIRLTAESSAFASGEGWRAYQDYIGQRILYPEFTTRIRAALYDAPQVQDAIARYAHALFERQYVAATAAAGATTAQPPKFSTILKKTRREAKRTIAVLVADLSSLRTVRLMAFVVNHILVRLYHQGIFIREAEFAALRDVARDAEARKHSLVFLPCHKSHVDYLVISYIFYRLGIALPHIVAGDNLNLPLVGSLLRSSGAFFIRRSFSDDPLYSTIVKEYIEILLQNGYNMEAFIEGTRSRVGKLLKPRFGIIKTIVEAVLANKADDCVIVPMSIGYDKVIETETYVNELLGNEKENESLAGLWQSSSLLNLRWGRIDVRFAKPFRLRAYIHAEKSRRGGSFNPFTSSVDKNLVIQSLGYRVLSDINDVSVIMPTSLVGTIILTLRGRGIGKSELIRRVDWLRHQILAKGGRVADFAGATTEVIVDRALVVLRDFIGQHTDLLEPVFYALKRYELSLYRNNLIHMFIQEAVLAAALYGTIKTQPDVPLKQVAEDTVFLSQLLKGEFIFKPGGIQENLDATLAQFVDAGIVEHDHSLAVVRLTRAEKMSGREHFDFHCFLVWPFVDTYALATIGCFIFVNDRASSGGGGGGGGTLPWRSVLDATDEENPLEEWMRATVWIDERAFMARLQMLGKTLYQEGDLTYFESVNKEILRNAIARLCEMGVLERRRHVASGEAKGGATPTKQQTPQHILTLTRAWVPQFAGGEPRGALWDLVESVARFRREGKTRRDNHAAYMRILRLCRVASAKL